ncbi:MAG: metal-sensing transcriptional repressor [Acidimicrobiales bacterium]
MSITKAVQAVGMGLLDQHIHHCVKASVLEDTDGGEARIDEAISAIARLLKA